ncbi:MAG: moaA [Hydrocarboniphaga sp.]|uniref:GTP 3',8-cyclase MoaA n=1 Tax=Hydrocarboniphaga sp. TaxID=2033016 RepID=UPI00261C58D3|nr:GTP 3',8-cyclase MoaA [Hydrocarboniphaga sp.]MDB5969770.1 moaA [Hydrocarboniphaga sp.]
MADGIAPALPELMDQHGRRKRKLRLSVTDRCNLRCAYCMPEHPTWLPRGDLLTIEELLRLTALFVMHLGITNVRLTGGEPTLRRGLPELIEGLQLLRPQGLQRISMTSNGTRLAELAPALKAAGLDDLNISIDARDPALFQKLTRGPIEPVLEGIAAAQTAGLPFKLNAVVIRDYNDSEIEALAGWAFEQDVELRFIEFMPLDNAQQWSRERVVTESEILQRLGTRFGAVEKLPRTASPATEYILGGHHRLGIITTVSDPFCGSCDRVRMTAVGELFACLFSAKGTQLRDALRAGEPDAALLAMIRGGVWSKEAGFAAPRGYVERPITMHRLGG